MKTIIIDRNKVTGKEVRELLDQWLENNESYDIIVKFRKPENK